MLNKKEKESIENLLDSRKKICDMNISRPADKAFYNGIITTINSLELSVIFDKTTKKHTIK